MYSSPRVVRTAFITFCLSGLLAHASDFPDPAVDSKSLVGDLLKGDQTAVLAGGCFWCVEAVFRQIAGVDQVVSGYTGGDAATAHYDMVSTGKTGHVESVKITYNPRKISYGQLLKVFFQVAHDPTQLNRQGPDVGPQYRSMIFYKDAEQKRIAETYIKQLDGAKVFHAPIVTEVVPLPTFYPAEEHHQNYCNRHPTDRYVQEVAMPQGGEGQEAGSRAIEEIARRKKSAQFRLPFELRIAWKKDPLWTLFGPYVPGRSEPRGDGLQRQISNLDYRERCTMPGISLRC